MYGWCINAELGRFEGPELQELIHEGVQALSRAAANLQRRQNEAGEAGEEAQVRMLSPNEDPPKEDDA